MQAALHLSHSGRPGIQSILPELREAAAQKGKNDRKGRNGREGRSEVKGCNGRSRGAEKEGRKERKKRKKEKEEERDKRQANVKHIFQVSISDYDDALTKNKATAGEKSVPRCGRHKIWAR